MSAMEQAWNVLKANPNYQARLQGTNQQGAGGSLPQQFMRRPGYDDSEMSAFRPSSANLNVSPRFNNLTPSSYERQMAPDVGREASFQKIPSTGLDESAISRQPKQGMRERMRDKKRQKKIARYEKTGAGKDYRAAFPLDDSQRSVFDTDPHEYGRFGARRARAARKRHAKFRT